MKNKIVVLCAPSAAGKDSIAKELSEHYNYKFVISDSSRPPRPYESEGNPYYFKTRSKFENMIANNEMIEFRTYNTLVSGNPDTWYYGVHKSSIDLSKNSYVVVLDITGLKAFKKEFGDNVISFYIYVDASERTARAIRRYGWDRTEWERRLADDAKVFSPQAISDNCDFTVENYVLEDCINEIIYDIKMFESGDDNE